MKLAKLVERYGSPLYVYELAELRAAQAALRGWLPGGSELYYSLKANPHPRLVSELRRAGCRAEVSSVGELASALVGGCAASECLYTGPGKSERELGVALTAGVREYSVDSPTDLGRVARAAAAAGQEVRVLLRVNPERGVGGQGLTMGGGPSQFGADVGWIRREPEVFRGSRWARVVGFHIYSGTNITEVATLVRMIEVGLEVSRELAEVLGLRVERLDLGGGFGHPFAQRGARPEFAGLREELERRLDEVWASWREGQPQLVFEAGRYLVGAAGKLVCRVMDVKESQGKVYVVLDSGIHHLGGMAGLRRVPRIGAELEVVERSGGGGGSAEGGEGERLGDARVVGPLCTPLDAWGLGVELPRVREGDVVAVANVGAYGLTGSLVGFLSRETPVEVVVEGGEVVEASQLVLSRSPR